MRARLNGDAIEKLVDGHTGLEAWEESEVGGCEQLGDLWIDLWVDLWVPGTVC